MPWKRLHSWFAKTDCGYGTGPVPLTLVTLRRANGARADEAAFYAEAEFQALADWTRRGRIVLMFAGVDRDELILLCADGLETMQDSVADLPFVAANLALADVREVVPVNRIKSYDMSSH